MYIYFIRHGNPDYVNDKLTKRGRYEAKKTAKYLSNLNIERIFASSQGRAKETAQFLSNKINIDLELLHWAEENEAAKDLGIMDENNHFQWLFHLPNLTKEFLKLHGDKKWYENKEISKYPFKHAVDRMNKEVDNWLKSINIIHDRKNKKFKVLPNAPKIIALFAHGGMGMEFLPSILDLAYPEFVSCFNEQHTCGITKIEINENPDYTARIVYFNKIVYKKK